MKAAIQNCIAIIASLMVGLLFITLAVCWLIGESIFTFLWKLVCKLEDRFDEKISVWNR